MNVLERTDGFNCFIVLVDAAVPVYVLVCCIYLRWCDSRSRLPKNTHPNTENKHDCLHTRREKETTLYCIVKVTTHNLLETLYDFNKPSSPSP